MTTGKAQSGISDHIDTKVSVPGTPGQAYLRYVGEIEGKNGLFGGLELIGKIASIKGKNNGDVDGVKYFEVQTAGSGLFIPLERLKQSNPQLSRPCSRRGVSHGGINTQASKEGQFIGPSNRINSNRASPIGSRAGTSRSNSMMGNKTGYSSTRAREVASPRLGSLNSSSSISEDTESKLSAMTASKNHLEKELDSLRAEHTRCIRDMNEKMDILNELQSTVETLQPLIENYEKEISDKDAKLLKQRKDFEKARMEWRESLDVLVNTHQEAEDFYESEIEKLSKIISELRSQVGGATQNMEKILLEKELNAKILEQEADLQRAAESTKDLKASNDLMEKQQLQMQREIENLTKQLSDLELQRVSHGNDTSSSSSSSNLTNDELIELQGKNLELAEKLKIKNAEIDSSIASFKDQIKKLEAESDEKLNNVTRDLERTIEILKSENEKLSDLVNVKEKELANALEAHASQTKEIEDKKQLIEEENSKLNNTLSSKEEELKSVIENNESISKETRNVIKSLEEENMNLKNNITNNIGKEVLNSSPSNNSETNEIDGDMKDEINLLKENDIKNKEALEELNQSLSSLKLENRKLVDQLKSLEVAEKELNIIIDDLKQENASLLTTITDLQQRETTIEDELRKEFENKKLQFEKEHLSIQEELNTSIETLKMQNQDLSTKLDESESTIKKLDAWKLTSQQQFQEFENTIKAKDTYISELKEQIEEINRKSGSSGEVSKLKSEIETLKTELQENSSLEKQIVQLNHDLEMRPTFNELNELQQQIEEIESTYKFESDKLSQELKEVIEAKARVEAQLEATNIELKQLKDEITNSQKDTSSSSVETSVSSSLPIYTPKLAIDPSNGKTNWCGLCEREGHDSAQCPYENDLF